MMAHTSNAVEKPFKFSPYKSFINIMRITGPNFYFSTAILILDIHRLPSLGLSTIECLLIKA